MVEGHANSLSILSFCTTKESLTIQALSLYYHTLLLSCCLSLSRLYSEAPLRWWALHILAQCFENTEDETESETSEAVVVGSKILLKMAFSGTGLRPLSGYLLTPVRPPLNLHQTC